MRSAPTPPLSEMVNALSAAYCRHVVEEDISEVEQQTRIAAFAGQVAVAGGSEQ